MPDCCEDPQVGFTFKFYCYSCSIYFDFILFLDLSISIYNFKFICFCNCNFVLDLSIFIIADTCNLIDALILYILLMDPYWFNCYLLNVYYPTL